MNSEHTEMPIDDILKLHKKKMLISNPEYQRGPVWKDGQKKKLIDSILRGYPLPLIYLHYVNESEGDITREGYEVIDGQQRINAMAAFREGAWKLYDPRADAAEARFPEFIRETECPWGGKFFRELSPELQQEFLRLKLPIVKITTDNQNEARDLFVRLQAGMPLNSQEKRDAWPGQFTEFVLTLAGKEGIERYPGHEFFNKLLKANRSTDRGKYRQLAAQIVMLYLTKRRSDGRDCCDINAAAIDAFYYENLDFDAGSPDAKRLLRILDKITALLGDGKRKKLIGHEAMSLVLLVNGLLDHYAPSWEDRFASAFDKFRVDLALAVKTRNSDAPDPHWNRYGTHTRVNSDRGESIRIRHEFFVARMLEMLQAQPKDPKRGFGELDRELCYHAQHKRCAVCEGEVPWDDAEVHHVKSHANGGRTVLSNAALVHKQCHPKSDHDVAAFAERWASPGAQGVRSSPAR